MFEDLEIVYGEIDLEEILVELENLIFSFVELFN